MMQETTYKNAVLDDRELQESLKGINPKFGDFVTRVAGEAWGLSLIDQKTKALITIAIDVINQDHTGAGNPFGAHLDMALKQGATRDEIEELLLFLCPYAGFNKVAGCFATLNEILDKKENNSNARTDTMFTTMNETTKVDYSTRDRQGKVAFYVPLWKREGISLELFDNYWKDVHGPVCARLPGQYQYWQFHVAHNEGGFWPEIPGLDYSWDAEDNFDGIAELTFESEQERQTFFKAYGILLDDEHNLFKKAIGYTTSHSNSITYVDAIANGAPNGEVEAVKFHVMVKKADGVSIDTLANYLKESFARVIIANEAVLKFRLHIFDDVNPSRADEGGVIRSQTVDKQYHAAYEIAFANSLEREKFFASREYATAVKEAAKYIKQIQPFLERNAYTFVYGGQMTLAGQRSAKVAELISRIGATNQLREDISSLMLGEVVPPNGKTVTDNGHNKQLQETKQPAKSGLGDLLQGIQHVGVTVSDKAKSLEFYTEVLGGKLVVGENDLVGDAIQNTLFQKEEIDALDQGIAPEAIDIPRLRSGKEDALDVNFISFGNTVIELIYFKEADQTNGSHSSVKKIPSHIGHVNAMHISFNVKEGIDLNDFAKRLEEEAHKRGMTNVVCNRIIRVRSEAERRAVALRYNSFKFWNEPESLAAGEPEIDWSHDPMEGWSLFYCKGPNGEQLEFNQVTRRVKNSFQEAMEEYNQANETSFTFPDNQVPQNIGNGKVNQVTDAPIAKPIEQTQERKPMSTKFPGTNTDIVKKLFSRGEAFDSEGFITFFTDNPVYQFGNFDVCLDKESIKKSADAFFSQIDAVYHEIKMMWEVGEAVFVEMDVLYWRKDGSMVSLPCFDIFRVEGDKFSELRIFMDVNPVFNPSIPVPKSASVLTVAKGEHLVPPGTMRKHFAEHSEGKERVAQGYVPKWATAGPKWPINPEKDNSSEQLKVVQGLSQAIMDENWEKVKTYLADDLLYKVGSGEPMYGPNAVVDFFKQTFKNTAKFYGHDLRKAWIEPGIITLEMDAKYELVPSKKHVKVACCDIYRMRGNKVSEWRVYADMTPWQI